MSTSQDNALLFEINTPHVADDVSPYDDFAGDDEDSEDPAGRAGHGHGRDHHPRRGKPSAEASKLRPTERPKVPAPTKAAFVGWEPGTPRLPLQRLTAATRTRDRDVLRPAKGK